MSAAKTSKAKSSSKPTAKSAAKSAKPAPKAAKPSKAPKASASKISAPKAAAPKAGAKASPKISGKSSGSSTAGKPVLKVAAKDAGKPAAKPVKSTASTAVEMGSKTKPEKQLKAVGKSATRTDAKSKSSAKGSKATPKVEESRFEESSLQEDHAEKELDAEFAEDLAQQDISDDVAGELDAEPVAQEEELSPSAALLRSMKPTSPDAEKAGEKKKKKDDLKLDRNGDLEAQWAQLKEKYKALKPTAYKMSESFEARTPILHKVLGWGFIITNQNDRLEVLFQQGIKFLISNYKA